MAGRKKGKGRVILKSAIFVIVAIVLSIAAISIFSQKPPVDIIEAARKAIAEARKAEADVYSIDELAAAEGKWQLAMDEWKINNDKNPLFRDYEISLKSASEAITMAKEAKVKSIRVKAELHEYIKKSIKSLRVSLSYIESVKEILPLNHPVRKRVTPVLLKLDEAESAYKRDDLITARNIIDSIHQSIEKLKDNTADILDNYFKSYPEWIRLNEEMKQWSKTHSSVSLVVDKFSRKCIVYKSGKIIREFDVELGINWLGDKVQKGDRATPEGKYTITVKKSGRNTIYYKALLINFPNAEDKRRFNHQKSAGNISRNALIGGSIEIHGGGGKGIDWTDGCVALTNKDMDNLYALCSVGTPVAIVGSLTPLDKLLNSPQEIK
ncbi:MAG: L,D-transpeptidase family protein [Bacteroidales bacterium]|nr:L,D-transpeptidase family protein [Bacteroidales bacterium]